MNHLKRLNEEETEKVRNFKHLEDHFEDRRDADGGEVEVEREREDDGRFGVLTVKRLSPLALKMRYWRRM